MAFYQYKHHKANIVIATVSCLQWPFENASAQLESACEPPPLLSSTSINFYCSMAVTGTSDRRSILKLLKRSQTLYGHSGMHLLQIVAQRLEPQKKGYLVRNIWAIPEIPSDAWADGPFSSNKIFSDCCISILRCVSLQ
jgi:hypothetical protein